MRRSGIPSASAVITIREAGATAVQELAFTLVDGLTYVDACIKGRIKDR